MVARILARVRPVLLVAALAILLVPVNLFAQPNQTNALVVLRGVRAPDPRLIAPAAASFSRVRATVIAQCGRDFLGRLDEALRPVDYMTTKAGVAARSWHKAGRAIDLKQSDPNIVLIRDLKQPKLRRVLLRCARQNSAQGQWYGPKRIQYRGKPGFYLDITGVMSAEGWNRIPAQQGVSEWWHYEYRAGAPTWDQAMRQVYSVRTLRQVYPRSFTR